MSLLSFHWYGFIIGCAIVVGWWATEFQARRFKYSSHLLDHAVWWALAGGLLGARVWHVLTDWPLYQQNIEAIFALNTGGLSIFGALLGGGIGVWLWSKLTKQTNLLTLLDLTVFGLPFAQALGRLGNFFNQELYGYPTSLPWAMYIAPENRLVQFSTSAYFHPLFAYESVLLVLFGTLLWWLSYSKPMNGLQIGSGRLFVIYMQFYAVIRILLDFARPDKAILIGGIGVNQAILIVLLVVTSLWIWYAKNRVLV